MLQHVVGNGYERIFFTEHRAVLADECQAVHIGVNHKADVVAALAEQVADFAEVFLQRLGVVGEVAGRFGVKTRHVRHAELPEKFRQNDAAHGVHGVDGHVEVGAADGFHVYEFEVFHEFDVALVVAEVLGVAAEAVHVGILKVAAVGEAHHLRGFGGREELALFVEEFQGVPLAGVMAGGDDDAAASLFHRNGQFGGRCGGETDVHHIEAHAHQRAADYVHRHLAGDAGIAAYDDFATEGAAYHFLAQGGVSRNGFCNVYGVERIAHFSADGAAETRNGFNECHILGMF